MQQVNGHIYEGPCKWYALLTESGTERKATIWLRRRQYHPYWPRYMGQIRLNRHRRGFRWRSVIPGYLFLPIPEASNADWRVIEQAVGVRGVMRHADYNFVEFREQDIADVARIEQCLNENPIAAAEGIPFREGQKVRIIRGVFENQRTEIVRIEKGRKVCVEVELFERKNWVWLPVADIEAA